MAILRYSQAQKIMVHFWTTMHISTEYPSFEGNALHLMESEGEHLFGATKTWSNHYWGWLPRTTLAAEPRIKSKMTGILQKTRQGDFSARQQSEKCGQDMLQPLPCFPDLAPSYYHLFRSIQNHLSQQHFSCFEDIQSVSIRIILKDEPFIHKGILLLPEILGNNCG